MSLFRKILDVDGEVIDLAPAKPAASLMREVVSDLGLQTVAGELDAIGTVFRGAPVRPSADLDRIVELPRRKLDPNDPRAAEAWTAHLRRDNPTCDCVERWGFCITSLRPVQGWGLEEASNANGFLGPIGVGHGKEGLCILAPWAFEGCKRAVIMVPSNLRAQLMTRDLPQWGAHFKIPNIAGVAGMTGGKFIDGRPVLYVMTYHDLSNAKATARLQQLGPDLIILNEAQNLGRPEAVRTKRFLKYFHENPETRLFAVSGTLTKKSIKDYAHLSQLALGEGSPLPLNWHTVEEWAGALDATDGKRGVAPMGALKVLCAKGESARQGFRRRLVDTPGVVGTEEGALDTRLVISARETVETPPDIKLMIGDVRDMWQRPDGEELVDPLAVAKVCRELACGFFYRWRWPRGEPKDLIDKWLAIRKDWRKEVREELKGRPQQHMDSPLLLARAATRWHDGYWVGDQRAECEACDGVGETIEGVECEACGGNGEIVIGRTFIPPHTENGPHPVWAADSWPAWREIKNAAKPETEAVWVDEFLARDAAEWVRSNVGIAWYEHSCFGARVAQLAQAPLYGGGPEASARIILENGKRAIVAAIRAHGVGKNLQCFARNLITNALSDGAGYEQLLARTHRPGQRADEVTAEVYLHTDELEDAFARAVSRARYIQETQGSKQKLLYADVTFEVKAMHAQTWDGF